MSEERWGVKIDPHNGAPRRLANTRVAKLVTQVFESRELAQERCDKYPKVSRARPVKLLPKGTKAQRRVFDGEVVRCPDGAELLLAGGHYYNIKELCGGIGARVSIQVTVLPEKKVVPARSAASR